MGRSTKVTDVEILQEIALSPDPIVTSSELADRMDYSTDGARNRLEDLVDKGYVGKKQIGARATAYWITSEGRNQFSSP